jgi:AcrR family transcriptional regulator
MTENRLVLASVNLDRERQILDAAAALFYEKGFHGVGVDEIGQRVGISGPALYRHFAGKDEILATLFNEAVEALIAATGVVYTDPHRDLERLVRHHVEFALDHRHLVNVYEREEKSLAEPWKQHFLRRQRHYAGRWEEALRRCFPETPDEQIAAGAQAAIGMIHSVAHWPRSARSTSELPDLLYRLVTYGLAALDGAGSAGGADSGATADEPARRKSELPATRGRAPRRATRSTAA